MNEEGDEGELDAADAAGVSALARKLSNKTAKDEEREDNATRQKLPGERDYDQDKKCSLQ